jgi:deoxyribodipyrimidine photo-lyase
MKSLVWFRLDLRLSDNDALAAAIAHGSSVIPVFIYAPEEEAPWSPGGASRWWLHHSLEALSTQLEAKGSKLIVRRGPTLQTLFALIRETGAEAVFWNRRYEPAVIARDCEVKTALRNLDVNVHSYNAALLREPWTIKNSNGEAFRVFSPFWRWCQSQADPAHPLPEPKDIPRPKRWPQSLKVQELELLPKINWAGGLQAAWRPGENGATANLNSFLAESVWDYPTLRNRPDIQGTARLSPHLHYGEISPRQVWHSFAREASKRNLSAEEFRNSQFITELGWREFAHHVLFHFPQTPIEPLRTEFKNFPWRKDAAWLRAWQSGRTGYPIVDAGMKELWTTGWMHNRVRMIVASFLVKDLLLPWQEGARWFWDTLVDADLAQNTLNWQWAAGCGTDAMPYFRVFNPTLQSEQFDPQGSYVRRWCPELANLSNKWVHKPASAPARILLEAGVQLSKNYPAPIVNHSIAREVALEAFAKIKAVQG